MSKIISQSAVLLTTLEEPELPFDGCLSIQNFNSVSLHASNEIEEMVELKCFDLPEMSVVFAINRAPIFIENLGGTLLGSNIAASNNFHQNISSLYGNTTELPVITVLSKDSTDDVFLIENQASLMATYNDNGNNVRFLFAGIDDTIDLLKTGDFYPLRRANLIANNIELLPMIDPKSLDREMPSSELTRELAESTLGIHSLGKYHYTDRYSNDSNAGSSNREDLRNRFRVKTHIPNSLMRLQGPVSQYDDCDIKLVDVTPPNTSLEDVEKKQLLRSNIINASLACGVVAYTNINEENAGADKIHSKRLDLLRKCYSIGTPSGFGNRNGGVTMFDGQSYVPDVTPDHIKRGPAVATSYFVDKNLSISDQRIYHEQINNIISEAVDDEDLGDIVAVSVVIGQEKGISIEEKINTCYLPDLDRGKFEFLPYLRITEQNNDILQEDLDLTSKLDPDKAIEIDEGSYIVLLIRETAGEEISPGLKVPLSTM